MVNYSLKSSDTLPTTTAHQSRLRIFQPTRRPVWLDETYQTKWGTCKVTGKIGQSHADVLESIFFKAEKFEFLDSGGMKILVDPFKVRSTAGGDKLNKAQLDKLLKDLMAVVIELKIDLNNDRSFGHIIDEVNETNVKAITRPGAIGQNRKMWRVDISKNFLKLINSDIKLYYDPAPIAQLTNGISQAIARHVLTHKSAPSGGWTVDKLIEAVGAGSSQKDKSNRRAELKRDAEGLKIIGLLLENGRILRKGD